jgi:Uma2 family endonuclease
MTLTDLDINKTYTYADYFKWKFEERVELIKGRIFSMTMPNRHHQQIVGSLFFELYNFLSDKGIEVYTAPFDVRFPHTSNDDESIITVLQPDICVICDVEKLDERGCIGAPDIVVEVLSLGNNSKDLKDKCNIYEDAGVKEYWIVSPQNEYFIKYTLVDGRYKPSRPMVAGDVVESSILVGFSLNLENLFKNLH